MKIIFDFDGVILDSNNSKKDAFVECYDELNDNLKEKIAKYHLKNLGVNRYIKIENIEKKILKNKNWKIDKEEKINNFSKIVKKKVLDSKFIPGVLNTIKRLNKDNDLFICSATPEKELVYICKKKKIFKYFKKIYGSPKSKKDILLNIMEKNKNLEKNFIYIGDAISDYNLAKDLKIKFISINNKIFNKKMNILNMKNFLNFEKINKYILNQ
tara:strand:+ start:204 stop:842 length:639 start_codon:yes stop_codon:yes gene_type:complete